jgi:membrane associated rhomboid family serine protease
MGSAWVIIPARSERQAMDWSLVLVSQGIETFLDYDPARGGWQLRVPSSDQARALEAIRLYRLENRRRLWQQPVRWAGLIFDWRSLGWFMWLIALFALCEGPLPQLRAAGLMDNRLVDQGQWWRLFTAVTLHGNLPHLASNVSIGILLLGLAMGSLGSGWGLLGAFLAGGLGNLTGWLFHHGHYRSLGASGMVMGALGLLAAQSLAWVRFGFSARQLTVRGLSAGVLLLILLGTNPGTDVLAHVAGFVWGGLLGGLWLCMPAAWVQGRWANGLGVGLCVGLAVLSWVMALR